MTVTRVAPGVPSGGQFAAHPHTASEVTLPEAASPPYSTEALLRSAFAAGDEASIHRLSACATATRLRQIYPDAAYLDLDWGGDGLTPTAVRDHFGDLIADSNTDD